MHIDICCTKLAEDIWTDKVTMSLVKQWEHCPYCTVNEVPHEGELRRIYCVQCGKPLTGTQEKYCSQVCTGLACRGTPRKIPILKPKKCKECGVVFIPKSTSQLYHSKSCMIKSSDRRAATKPTGLYCTCGKPLMGQQKKYCSVQCRGNSKSSPSICLLKDCNRLQTNKHFPWCCEEHHQQYMKSDFTTDGESNGNH